MLDINKYEEMLKKITPGIWTTDHVVDISDDTAEMQVEVLDPQGDSILICTKPIEGFERQDRINADFIAQSSQLITDMVGEVKRLNTIIHNRAEDGELRVLLEKNMAMVEEAKPLIVESQLRIVGQEKIIKEQSLKHAETLIELAAITDERGMARLTCETFSIEKEMLTTQLEAEREKKELAEIREREYRELHIEDGRCIAGLEAQLQSEQWISVGDRLPEEKLPENRIHGAMQYLVSNKQESWVAYFSEWGFETSPNCSQKATHWKPITPPTKESK